MKSSLRSKVGFAFLSFFLWSGISLFGQDTRIAREILAQAGQFGALDESRPLLPLQGLSPRDMNVSEVVEAASFFAPDLRRINTLVEDQPQYISLNLPIGESKAETLWLRRADIFTDAFTVTLASRPGEVYPYRKGAYYWGIVAGKSNSLVALSFSADEVMGFIQLGEHTYTLGKVAGDPASTHILYATDDLKVTSGINCYVDASHDPAKGRPAPGGARYNANNCVRMYIEADYDLFVAKGGVQQTVDYLTGAFGQVAILYANENIDFTVNEIKVWDVVDPYTGPSTSNFLTQFRTYLNGNFNGDLAQLVGTTGGGGVAYVNVLCYKAYGVSYSMIYSTYANVPVYSWTIEVLTHEIGHNLGSPHTHDCSWNGNNTAIDGCGPTAGYSGGNCPTAPLPSNGGTIMSYCHLIGGVGINFNNGFGPQPGDLIRSRVYNAACLTPCTTILNDAGITAITAPVHYPCQATTDPVVKLDNFGNSTLTSVNIRYQVDTNTVATYAWTGSLAPAQSISLTLPAISYAEGAHVFKAWTELPNGQPDEVPSNDLTSVSFSYYVGWCECNVCVADILPNPLTHAGSGSSSASVTFEPGSKNPVFDILELNARLNGPTANRFNESVTVTYVNGNGETITYGTFLGSQQSSVTVSITGFVNSITIALSNALNNGYTGTLSVSFSGVSFCSPPLGCPDADCDGICDDVDLCPNLNDMLIGMPCDDGDPCTDNDLYAGSPDCGCAGTPNPFCCPNKSVSSFSPNPLNHQGSGETFSNVTLPVGQGQAIFTISNINARTTGQVSKRFIDLVTVTYKTTAGGSDIVYGVFRGDQVSSVVVMISGPVYSIRLGLQDAYDGNTGTMIISVSMTTVESCPVGLIVPSGETPETAGPQGPSVYPNPATDELYIRSTPGPVHAMIYNALGSLMASVKMNGDPLTRISLSALGIRSSQMIYVTLLGNDGSRTVHPVWIVD